MSGDVSAVRQLVRRGRSLSNAEAYVLLDALDAAERERDRMRGELTDALDELNQRQRVYLCQQCLQESPVAPDFGPGGGDGC
jgi:rubrerythrin